MKILTSHTTIGRISFEWVNSIEIESSWELLTDTAKIILPAAVQVKTDIGTNRLSSHDLLDHIKLNDVVVIKIGYDGELNTLFTGYVTQIIPRVPIELHCQDEMFKLKQITINESYRSATTKKIIEKHFSYPNDVLDVELGKYYIKNISGAQLLENFKKDFSLYSFFKGDKLIVGKQYQYNNASTVRFEIDYNIISENLEYKTIDQVILLIRAISIDPEGKRTSVEVGKTGGQTITIKFYDVSKTVLTNAAKRELNRLSYDGWRGSFIAFGSPFVEHGDIVELTHPASEKAGKYWVDKVYYDFGLNGFRQKIQLGAKA